MNDEIGSLTITARRAGRRTVLERVRYDGILRCSRAFAQDGAALVVLSQLGPGVVRGDIVSTSGRVRTDAHLIVTYQSATRVMGGTGESSSVATWSLDEGSLLELIGEPVIAAADARYRASTTIDLAADSSVLISEVACVPSGADVHLRTSVRRGDCEVFYDAFDPAAAAPQAVGTFALVGLRKDRVGPFVAACDEAADSVHRVRIGVGALPTGVFARVLAPDTWAVREALMRLREATAPSLRAAQRAGGFIPAVDSSANVGSASVSRGFAVT